MENVLIKRISSQALSDSRLEQVISWLLTFLIFLIPFQKRFTNFLKSFAYSLIPQDLVLPSYFSKKIGFYLSDATIAIIVILCLYRFRGRLRSLFFSTPSQFLFAFLLVSLISISCSISKHYLLQYIRVVQFSLFVLLFACISQMLRHVNQEALIKKVAWAFLLASLIQCGISISQYFLQASIGLKALGEFDIWHFTFPMQGGKRWLIDNLTDYHSNIDKVCRVSGTFSHPNILGGFLFVAMIMTYYLHRFEEKKYLRSLLHLAVSIQIFTLAITFSRSAILATGLATLCWFAISFFKLKAISPGALSKQLLLFLTVILSSIGSLVLLYDQFFSRGGIVSYNEFVSGADKERVAYQNMAWEMFKDHPLIGIGYNNFQLHSKGYDLHNNGTELFAKVHNIYLLVLAETGALGAFCFLMCLFWILKSAVADAKHQHVFLVVLIGLLFIGCCDYYLLHTQDGKLLLFSIGGLSCCSNTS